MTWRDTPEDAMRRDARRRAIRYSRAQDRRRVLWAVRRWWGDVLDGGMP